MRGTVTPYNEAVMRLVVRGADQDIALQVVIDTGFSDYLMLPRRVINQLGLMPSGAVYTTLADGTTTYLNAVVATVIWGDEVRVVPALEAEGGALVGMNLLRGFRVTIDVIDGGPVNIVPLG